VGAFAVNKIGAGVIAGILVQGIIFARCTYYIDEYLEYKRLKCDPEMIKSGYAVKILLWCGTQGASNGAQIMLREMFVFQDNSDQQWWRWILIAFDLLGALQIMSVHRKPELWQYSTHSPVNGKEFMTKIPGNYVDTYNPSAFFSLRLPGMTMFLFFVPCWLANTAWNLYLESTNVSASILDTFCLYFFQVNWLDAWVKNFNNLPNGWFQAAAVIVMLRGAVKPFSSILFFYSGSWFEKRLPCKLSAKIVPTYLDLVKGTEFEPGAAASPA